MTRNGAQKWNVLPLPTALSRRYRPFIKRTSWAEIASPRPVPPKGRVVELSACTKGRKIASCFSGGMPMPVSATEK